MFNSIKTDYDIQRHLISLIHDNAFFAEISRHIKKTATDSIPTMAIGFDPVTEDITLGYNPTWCQDLKNLETRGVLIHEFYHLIFKHITYRRRQPHDLWNVATDLAINSLIVDAAKKHAGARNIHVTDDDKILPDCVLLPGQFPRHPDGREFTPEEKKGKELALIIEKLPLMQSSEWYFNKIMQEAEKNQQANGKGGGLEGDQQGKGQPDGKGGGLEGDQQGKGQPDGKGQGKTFADGGYGHDNHDFWDDIPEEKREIVDGKIRNIIEKAVNFADQSADGWGNIPADIQAEIRKSISKIINWRTVLRQFAGTLVRGNKRNSMKRINKRFPYIHPGSTKKYMAKLLIAIDQSGSVDDNMLNMFFAELRSFNKNIEFDILPFDCEADVKDIYTWRRGSCPAAKRTKGGGTDFNAPTRVANDPRNRGRWDGLLIMSDGECSKPGPSRMKRGWIIGKGQKLNFDTHELVIKLDDGKINKGICR